MKSKLETNGDLHMTYLKDDGDLYYFIFNWTAGNDKVSTALIPKLSLTDNARVVFIGTDR